jgi:hypothetical protein
MLPYWPQGGIMKRKMDDRMNVGSENNASKKNMNHKTSEKKDAPTIKKVPNIHRQ